MIFIDTPKSDAASYIPLWGAVVSVVSALIGAAVVWARDLGAQAKRIREIEEAKKLVEFWDAWQLSMHSTEESGNFPGITEELVRVARTVQRSQSKQRPLPFYLHWERMSSIRKALFLFWSPSLYLTFSKFLFYVFLLWSPFELAEAFGVSMAGKPDVHRSAFQIAIRLAGELALLLLYYSQARYAASEAQRKSREEEVGLDLGTRAA